MILDLYFDLYDNDPEYFAHSKDEEDSQIKKYTFSPLSSLMAEELMNLSHERVLVSQSPLKLIHHDFGLNY